ncbi:low-density lipoprotein receptor class A domain-containing protein 1 isoform X2 [Sciurus carolinensis]|uniref:low-density lipoprotein receptor class A domain-containing protein 1 isoform X2 n=1 Tax=Sciurus carolinensis TaxID=30640 RepID=UPI001FB2016C|nr:low-density lipoprotein receptor class A domain-containing protein 1 isoform X2 [Sciurus carolinensis]
MNKIFAQGDVNLKAAAGTRVLPGGKANCSPCCSRRGACLSLFLLLLLATLAALITLVVIFGLPPRTSGAQACVTLTNRTGFLCHDQRSCIPASRVCDGLRTCPHGDDEDESLCRPRNFHHTSAWIWPVQGTKTCLFSSLDLFSPVMWPKFVRCPPEPPQLPPGPLWRPGLLDLLRPKM